MGTIEWCPVTICQSFASLVRLQRQNQEVAANLTGPWTAYGCLECRCWWPCACLWERVTYTNNSQSAQVMKSIGDEMPSEA